MNKINLLTYIFISLLILSCDKIIEDNQDLNEENILTTKTVYINQSVDGTNVARSVIIQTPSIIDQSKDYPLVFAFHGRGGKNKNWVNKLKNFTDNGEFIGVYPQGYLDSWNLGTEPSKADDVEFISMIINRLKQYNNIDMNKLYAIGISNGSGMVNKLGIETSHFKAIAPIVSQLMESMPILNNTKPISVFQFNGALDSTIPIDGGSRFGHVFLDALKSAELWATNFECSFPAEIQSNGNKTLYIFTDCNDGKEIRYYRIENGQHNLEPSLPTMFLEIWNFFKKF